MDAIVGIQTREICRKVGIPTINAATHRSRPSNCRCARVVFFAAVRGGFVVICSAVAKTIPRVNANAEAAPAEACRRARPKLFAEDHFGLSLHIVKNRVDLRRIRQEVRKRLTCDI